MQFTNKLTAEEILQSYYEKYLNGDTDAFLCYPGRAAIKLGYDYQTEHSLSKWICNQLSEGKLSYNDLEHEFLSFLANSYVDKLQTMAFIKRFISFSKFDKENVDFEIKALKRRPHRIIAYMAILNSFERSLISFCVMHNRTLSDAIKTFIDKSVSCIQRRATCCPGIVDENEDSDENIID
ncbi:MAG: hypothetical protein MJZ34_13885 [Paludibacteraceae bacterium]|nr:hypothetical protein [Paludibacteraceae bacterium]